MTVQSIPNTSFLFLLIYFSLISCVFFFFLSTAIIISLCCYVREHFGLIFGIFQTTPAGTHHPRYSPHAQVLIPTPGTHPTPSYSPPPPGRSTHLTPRYLQVWDTVTRLGRWIYFRHDYKTMSSSLIHFNPTLASLGCADIQGNSHISLLPSTLTITLTPPPLS